MKFSVLFCTLLLAMISSCAKNVGFVENEKAEFLYNKAVVTYLRGDLVSSEKEFTEIVQKYPDYAPAEIMLGKTYYFENKMPEAEKHFQASLKSSPNIVSYIWLSKIAVLKKDDKKGFEYLSKALALDFSNPLTHFELGKYYKRLGKTEKAVYHFNYAISYEDMYPEMKWELASLYTEIGAKDMALLLLKDLSGSKNLTPAMESNVNQAIQRLSPEKVSTQKAPVKKSDKKTGHKK